MAKTKTAQLTSKERCQKAFEEWFAHGENPLVTPISGGYYDRMQIAWHACWKYLERQVITEFIEK